MIGGFSADGVRTTSSIKSLFKEFIMAKTTTIRQTSHWKSQNRAWSEISKEEYESLQGGRVRTEVRLATFKGDPKNVDTWVYQDTVDGEIR